MDVIDQYNGCLGDNPGTMVAEVHIYNITTMEVYEP